MNFWKETADDWTHLSPQAMELANEWADRNDLLVTFGPECGGSTAFFHHTRAEIELNTDLAFAGMSSGLTRKNGIYSTSIAVGMLYHEAMHAKHSPDPRTMLIDHATEGKLYQAMTVLEEARIEALGSRDDRTMVKYLRASATRVILADLGEEFNINSDLVALLYGRVIGGVFDAGDVKPVTDKMLEKYGKDIMDQASVILEEYFRSGDNPTEIRELAEEWVELFSEHDDADEKADRELMEMLGDILGDILNDASEEIAKEVAEKKRRETRERQARETKRKANSKRVALGGFDTHREFEVRYREPSQDEKRAATALARVIQQLDYTGTARPKINAELPPGRMRPRAVISNRVADEVSGRGSGTALEWRSRKNHREDAITPRVGIIVDVSGSMSSAAAPMSSTNYVLSAALRKTDAKFVQVAMGRGAWDLTKHNKVGQVPEWNANQGTEFVTEAVARLDYQLNLLDGKGGPRLAVMVSDGQFHYNSGGEVSFAKQWIQDMIADGASVLWLGYGSVNQEFENLESRGMIYERMTGRESPVEVAQIVGKHVRALFRR